MNISSFVFILCFLAFPSVNNMAPRFPFMGHDDECINFPFMGHDVIT